MERNYSILSFICVIVSFSVGLAACKHTAGFGPRSGPDGGVAGDMGEPADATAVDAAGSAMAFVEAPHPAAPQVQNQGGPVLTTPELVTVTWTGDPIAADLEAFDAWVISSPHYLPKFMPQYGFVSGSHLNSWRAPAPTVTTLDDATIQQFLLDAIAAGSLPAPSANTLYSLYPPDGVIVTQGGYIGCQDMQAYHSSVVAPSGAEVVYAVSPRCHAEAQQGHISDLNFTTLGSSHEIAEAISDPLYSQPAWLNKTAAVGPIGEIGDLCVGHPLQIDGHTVTGIFSNTAAAAGERSCVPASSGPNFGGYFAVDSLSVTAGTPATLNYRVFATAPIQLTFFSFAGDSSFTVTPQSQLTTNGDSVPVVVSVPAGTAPGMKIIEVGLSAPGYQTSTILSVDVR